MSDDWRERGRVAGAKLKSGMVLLRRDAGEQWRNAVVDMMVTSTYGLNESFKEKDNNYEIGPSWKRGRKMSQWL